MEIARSIPPENLVIELHFIQTFEVQKYESNPFLFKLMGLFLNLDQMVGQKYVEGLASLKAIVES